MLHVSIHCVGKLREKYYQQASSEYLKRLSKYVKISVVETPDLPAPQKFSPAQIEQVKKAEGGLILAKIPEDAHVTALAIDGARYTSEAWAQRWQQLMNSGKSKISLVIGGSHGLSDEVLQRSNDKLSFSDFTFDHQLMRLILMEQIFRSMKILANECYHK